MKNKRSRANKIRVVSRAKSADPRMTETDGGAGGPSGSEDGDAVGPTASPRTKPQYGLPTDGGARGPGGSASASSSSFGPPPPAPTPLQQALEDDILEDDIGPPPPAPPPLPQALEGDTRAGRKKSRDLLRAGARKQQQPVPPSYNPHGYLDVPQICNRIATPWSSPPADCQCAVEWPTFFAAALMSGQATRMQTTPCYDGTMTIEPGTKPSVSYRRPGGHLMKERWWYNGVLLGFAKVTDKLGHSKTIALAN
jgi:hypothetical protein